MAVLFLLSLLLFTSFLLLFLRFIVRPSPVKIPINGRHVFITGGSTGIGLAIAHQAVAAGAHVSILARSPDKLDEAKQEILRVSGVDVAVYAADVRDPEALKRVVAAAGPIDVLVVNQGMFVAGELEKVGLDIVKDTLEINLIGSFNMVKAVLPLMKQTRRKRGPGSIAFMSSMAGQVGVYGYSAYSASKFGLRGFAESLQQEVINDDIHISLICPPSTQTITYINAGLTAFVSEVKSRPALSAMVVMSGGLMKEEDVARKSLDGIKAGKFIIHCNFLGFLSSLGTAGFSPQRSFWMAWAEVNMASLARLVQLWYLWKWYRAIQMKKKVANSVR